MGTLTDPAGAILSAATSALGADKVADLINNINNNQQEQDEMDASARAVGESNTIDTSTITANDFQNIEDENKSTFTKGEFVQFGNDVIYDSNIPKPDPTITSSEMATICDAINSRFSASQLSNLKLKEKPVQDLLTVFQCQTNTNTSPNLSKNAGACNLITGHLAKTDPYMNTANLMLQCELPFVNIVDKDGYCLDHQGAADNTKRYIRLPCKNALPKDQCSSMLAALQQDLARVKPKRDEIKAKVDDAKARISLYQSKVTACQNGDFTVCIDELPGEANTSADLAAYYNTFLTKAQQDYDINMPILGALNDDVNYLTERVSSMDCNISSISQLFRYAPYDYTIKSFPISQAQFDDLPRLKRIGVNVDTSNDAANGCMTIQSSYGGRTELQNYGCNYGNQVKTWRVNTDVNNIITEDKTLAIQNAALTNIVQVKRGDNYCLTAMGGDGSQVNWGWCQDINGGAAYVSQLFKKGANGSLQTVSNPTYCVATDLNNTNSNLRADVRLTSDLTKCANNVIFTDSNGVLKIHHPAQNYNTCFSYDRNNSQMVKERGADACLNGSFVPAQDFFTAVQWQIGNESMYFRVRPIDLTPATWVESWIAGKGTPADAGLNIQDLFYSINNTEDRSQYYFLKANRTEFWVRAPFSEDRMLGYVSGTKVGYLFRDGRWDVFKRFVTNQGLPLEYTCNWFTRAGGVLDSLKKKATDGGNSEIMQELLSGLILEGTKISTYVKDRSEIFGGKGGSPGKVNNPAGFSAASMGFSNKINSIAFRNADSGNWGTRFGSSYGDETWAEIQNGSGTPIKGISGQTNMYYKTVKVFGVYPMKVPDPDAVFIANLGVPHPRKGAWPDGAIKQEFEWSCPDANQHVDTIYMRSGGVVDAIQIECTKRKVTIGYVDDNHVGQLKTPDGDWIPIGAMFTLIGNTPKMAEAFAFMGTGPVREGFGCGWSAPWDCAKDAFNAITASGEAAIGWIKDTAGKVYNSVQDFVVNTWDTVSSWAVGLGTAFYEWAKNAGATFVQTMVSIGNGISDGLKAGFNFVANSIGPFITSIINDIYDGLKKFVNVLSDLAEIVKDFVMGIIRKITGSMGKWWTILKTYLAAIITVAFRGRQCLFLKYSKTDPYKALRYLVFIAANPIELPCVPPISTFTNCKNQDPTKKKPARISPGLRPPIKKQIETFITNMFGTIPYIGPLVRAGVYICKLPPMVNWIDYKIDTEVLIPIFDLFRNQLLAIFVPAFDATLSWSCNALMDVKDKITGSMSSSLSSKTTEDGDAVDKEAKAAAATA